MSEKNLGCLRKRWHFIIGESVWNVDECIRKMGTLGDRTKTIDKA